MTDDLHRLAEEFPARFKRGVWEVKFRVGDTWFSVEPEGNACVSDAITEYLSPHGTELLDLEISSASGQALLHAALVELLKEARMSWAGLPSGPCCLYEKVESHFGTGYKLLADYHYQETLLEAVLAAADEIKRRLQEVTT